MINYCSSCNEEDDELLVCEKCGKESCEKCLSYNSWAITLCVNCGRSGKVWGYYD